MKRITALGIAAAAAVAGAAYWATLPGEPGLPDPFGAAMAAQDADSGDAPAIREMALGSEDAKVVVHEYASFTCPHCAAFHANQFKKLKDEYIDTGKVRFVFRDVYFDRYGLWAAMIARCAGPDRFFGVAGMIFDEQRGWLASNDPKDIVANLQKIGRKAGMDTAQLESCLEDRAKAKALVGWFKENAKRHDVNSTPTLVINGKTHRNMSYAEMKKIIDGHLGG